MSKNNLNLTAVTKWLNKAPNTDNRCPIVLRSGSDLMFTDSMVVIRLPEEDCWELIGALPGPLPAGEGAFHFQNGIAKEFNTGLLRAIELSIPNTELAAFEVQDTKLLRYEERKAGKKMKQCLVHFFAANNGYFSVKQEYLDLFTSDPRLSAKDRKSGLVLSGVQDAKWFGLILPFLNYAEAPNFMAPIPQAEETAAD